MSAKVDGDNISLTRGDTLILNIQIVRNNEAYIPETGDTVRFALSKDKSGNAEPLILKEIDPSTLQLTINPEDTKSLSYGTYFYDVQLTTVDGYVDTFIGPAKFKITEEVY